MQFPELAKEAGITIIHLWSTFAELRMRIALDVPNAVWQGTATSTRDLLLLEAPFRKLHLVGEQNAAGHHVDELELGLDRPQAFFGFFAVRHGLDDLHAEQVIGISFKAFVAIGGNLVLPFSLGDGPTNIVRVQTTIRGNMVQADEATVDNPRWFLVVPGQWAQNSSVSRRVNGPVDRLGLILGDPDIVLILVRVQRHLLLLTSARVHVDMRMQVATLRVVVAEAQA